MQEKRIVKLPPPKGVIRIDGAPPANIASSMSWSKTGPAKIRFAVCLLGVFLAMIQRVPGQDRPIATSVVTVADDFVADVYYNGKQVRDSSRHLISDKFGAEAEKDAIIVSKGDWLVFHVVNFPIRWDGVCFFAAAGLLDEDHFGFVSDLNSQDWSFCDNPSDVNQFIRDEGYLCENKAQEIPHPWRDGIPRMKEFAGSSWRGDSLWGRPGDHSVWLKIIIN